MTKRSQTSTADCGDRPGGAEGRARLPMLGNYVVFSVILFVFILAVASAAFFFSMQQIIRDNKGRELTKLLELERIKLENYVNKEIAIVLKMASSPLIRRHFEYPADVDIRQLAVEEINAYRRVLMGQIFWVNDTDKLFYFEDREPYLLNVELPENYWYPMTLNETKSYNFNINYNPDLNVTNLWVNAPVFSEANRPVGILGTGIDLSAFISTIYAVYRNDHRKAYFYFFNEAEEITGAEDVKLVAEKRNIREQLGRAGAYTVAAAKSLRPGEAHTFAFSSGQAAVISIPTLQWYAVAILPDSIGDYNTPLTVFFCLGIAVVAFILILSNIFIARLLVPLRETMTSLEAASKAKSDFLAKMSHEIRTPMNAIMGVAQIQLEKKYLHSETHSAFELIHSSSITLLNIINDILDMSKIETGKLTLNPVEYDLPSLICDVVQLNAMRIGSKPVEFKLFVRETLPSRFFGDDLRLKQVLNNILSNSFKYTERGSVTLSVSHAAGGGNDDVMLIFVIEDTGQGIKEDDLKKLFSEYLRLNTDLNRNVEGTGLGLNITRRLVEMMDGRIDVESEYGKGSAFTVTVRQKTAPGTEAIGAEYADKMQKFSFSDLRCHAERQINREPIPGGSVLVVDDVETNLAIAEMLLTPYGLDIDKADGGAAVIEKINAGKVYDVIFMDHMMPEMDGLEATKTLRSMGYAGTIVALTANAIVGNKEMFIKGGFDDFISKPIDVAELDSLLRRHLRDKKPEFGGGAAADSAHIPPVDTPPWPQSAISPPVERRQATPIKMNERFLGALKRDVARALTAIRESVENGVVKDIERFTTTVHGLKSALAAIGENDKSQMALELEMAGKHNDTEFISDNTENFIKALEELTGNE